MLKKELTTPGVRVIVNDPVKDGLGGTKDALSITYDVGGFFNGGYAVGPGSILEIVKKPRKSGGINSVRVKIVADDPKYDGKEGEVFWCELRASCTMIS